MARILIGRTLSADTDSVRVAGLVPEAHDWIGLTYDGLGKLVTVVYKVGGAGGATVATLTLAYAAGRLTSVTRT